MANQEQLKILKQGFEAWNAWREQNPNVEINLTKAVLATAKLGKVKLWGSDLTEANLTEANLTGVNLWGANLTRAKLTQASLTGANLTITSFSEADLKGTVLAETNLSSAKLIGANLEYSVLRGANLKKTNFESANLQEADLENAIFTHASLAMTNFLNARIDGTIFANTDLSQALNLEKVWHIGPSTIGEDTIAQSKGQIPESFLRGCGLTDWQIESAKLYNPDLTNEEIIKIQYRMFDLRAIQALQISPLFISYSHADKLFVDHLDSALTKKGVRFWRDIHDAKAGRLETQVDRAIRQNQTVLLVLSKNSLNSDWVQHEVRKTRELERELGRDALCPVALDNTWQSSHWPQRLMEQVMEYNILDFSDWEDDSAFNTKFAKLLSGLDLFYKKSET